MKERTQQTAIVPTTQTTSELIPEPTARLVEKSFAQKPPETANTPYGSFKSGSRGDRSQTDYSLPISHTCLTRVKHQGQFLSLCPQSNGFSSTTTTESLWNFPLRPQPYQVSVEKARTGAGAAKRADVAGSRKDMCCPRGRRHAPRYPKFRYSAGYVGRAIAYL